VNRSTTSRSSSATPQVSRSSSSTRSTSTKPQVTTRSTSNSRSGNVSTPQVGRSTTTRSTSTTPQVNRGTGSHSTSGSVTRQGTDRDHGTSVTTRSGSGSHVERDASGMTRGTSSTSNLNSRGKTDDHKGTGHDKGNNGHGGYDNDRHGNNGHDKDNGHDKGNNGRGKNDNNRHGHNGNGGHDNGHDNFGGNHGYNHNYRFDYGNHHYRDQFSWNYSHHNWGRPLPPPVRPHRHAPWRWYRPTIPAGWYPYAGAPIIDRILGLVFGSLYEASLDHLYYNGYYIDGYADGIIYLRDVPMLNMYWPDAMLNYDYNRLVNAQFVYYSDYYDTSRFNAAYRSLCRIYGSPVYRDGMTISWYGGNSQGYVTLSMVNDYGDYYTTISIGY